MEGFVFSLFQHEHLLIRGFEPDRKRYIMLRHLLNIHSEITHVGRSIFRLNRFDSSYKAAFFENIRAKCVGSISGSTKVLYAPLRRVLNTLARAK